MVEKSKTIKGTKQTTKIERKKERGQLPSLQEQSTTREHQGKE